MAAASARLDHIAATLDRACADRGVACTRAAIPYGVKFTLTQGAVSGVISAYTSGKIVPNPRAEAHFAEIVAALAPVTAAHGAGAGGARGAGDLGLGKHKAVAYPYLGSDESGKGDYFGPVAVAAVLVLDPREAELLATLGVRDSKLLTGTRSAREIATQVRAVSAGRFAEIVILPETYNRRVAELKDRKKTSNALLAWAHVEAYGPLLGQGAVLAVTDKFGGDHYIVNELGQRGRGIEIRQETKGERYVAVAAASILARDRCLAWFDEAEKEVGERIPRGAFDPEIVQVARRIYRKGGEALLSRFAKLHFRTTLQVTGVQVTGVQVTGQG
jgi:ribonuclease HIII